MLPLTKGRYTARRADLPHDIARARSLRHLCFIANRGLVTTTTDADAFDEHCHHILIEDHPSGTLVCCFRLLPCTSGAAVITSYSAQFYDLVRLSAYPGPMAELGRFCIHPDHQDPDILRLAWGALTGFVDATGIQMLFGCTSFDGANPAKHQNALSALADQHLAPMQWRPGTKAAETYPLAAAVHEKIGQGTTGQSTTLPPLLRTYLAMGGWVSDHAVIDATLNTLHVFTGLEVAAIPPARARALRLLAG